MIDYAMGREHFVDMGEQMHRHIYDVNLGWGQFLDFYSDLNNARKESDEKYVERNYIGEEIPEPEERPIVNDDLIDNYDDNYGQILDIDLQSDRSVSENFGNGPTVESSNVLTELQDEIREEEKVKIEDSAEPEITKEEGNEEEQRLIVEEKQ